MAIERVIVVSPRGFCAGVVRAIATVEEALRIFGTPVYVRRAIVHNAHVVRDEPGEPTLLYVDLHLVHEVTSPQAFEGLRLAGRPVRRPELTVATMDHNVPTTEGPVRDELARQLRM